MNRETIQDLAKAALLDMEVLPILCDAIEELNNPFFDSINDHFRETIDSECSYSPRQCPLLRWLAYDIDWTIAINLPAIWNSHDPYPLSLL